MNFTIRPITPRKPKTEQEVLEEQKQKMYENEENSREETQ